jgi:ribosomal protein S12 methylthiotransferase
LNPDIPPKKSQGTYSVVTLGCPKNLVDTERMLGLLQLDGYQMVQEPSGTDFVVINTCGFIRAAREESLATIREMIALKEGGETGGVIVAGCMVQKQGELLLDECPGIDQIVGVFGRDEIVRAAERLTRRETGQRSIVPPPSETALYDGNRLRITPRHVGYLKISEGCDRTCTFCSIPSIRGKHVSKPIEQVVDEARQLADDGVRELILIAQDTTYYGIDRDGRPQLAELLRRLDPVEGIEWIRLMYLYPMHVSDELIDTIVGCPKVIHYLDMPLQHAADGVLRRMNRRIDRAETDRLIERLRERIEGLVLRTTMLTGFPGETEEDFEELLRFVRERRFERLGVFEFSPEPGTPASRMEGRCPADVAAERRQGLMLAQQRITFEANELQIGTERDILIDSCIPSEENAYLGRSYAEAPEIDGVVYVTGNGLGPGQIVRCEIVAAREYDLIAAAVGRPR